MNIRLLITANPFVLVQMGAHLKKLAESDPPETKSWLILSPRIDMSRTNFDPTTLVDRMSDLCRDIAAMVDLPIIDLPLTDLEGVSLTGFSILQVQNTLAQRRHAARTTAVFRDLLSQMSVTADQVTEIWMANSPLEKPAQKVCPAAKIIAFEHGLSDFHVAALYRNSPTSQRQLPGWLISLYRRLEHAIVGVPRNMRLDRHISLLDEQLCRFDTELPHEQLSVTHVARLLGRLSQNPSYDLDELGNVPGPWCIILMDTVTMHSSDPACSSTYNHELLHYLGNVLASHLKACSIRNILVKRRIEQTSIINQLPMEIPASLSDQFNVVVTKPGYQSIISAECLALSLDTRMIVGNISSGLFYTRKLLPQLMTYSYHRWQMAFTQKQFGESYYDLIWLDEMIYGEDSKFYDCQPFILPTEATALHN